MHRPPRQSPRRSLTALCTQNVLATKWTPFLRDGYGRRMTLMMQRIDAAVVRPLTASELRNVRKRERRSPRDHPHTLAIEFPWVRRVAYSGIWTLWEAARNESLTSPMRLPVSPIGGTSRSFWLIGNEVYSVSDRDVTGLDVLALVAPRRSRRDAQLRRAHQTLRSATPTRE